MNTSHKKIYQRMKIFMHLEDKVEMFRNLILKVQNKTILKKSPLCLASSNTRPSWLP